jgi:hypothetical protein
MRPVIQTKHVRVIQTDHVRCILVQTMYVTTNHVRCILVLCRCSPPPAPPPPHARTQRRCGSGGSTPQGSGSTHQAGANADNRGPRQGGKCGGKGRCKSPARGLSLCQRPDFDSFRVQWALLSDPPNGGGSRSLSRSKARMTCTHPPTHARTHSHTHTQERTHARTHAHTDTRTQAHTDARAHARTHR